jgi:hypothetical protein
MDYTMKINEWDSKECFGQQAEDMLHGEAPYKCLECDIFDKCHKITIAACLQSISTGMDLLIENGLMTKKLMGFEALGKLSEAEMKKKN